MSTRFNLNDAFSVTLTDVGASFMNVHRAELNAKLKAHNVEKHSLPFVKPGDVIELSLAEMANIFGPALVEGVSSPFEDFSITFVKHM